jgi:hypothetical protein
MTKYPALIEMRQTYVASRHFDYPDFLGEQFATAGILKRLAPGKTVGVGVGSRGITNLKEIVKATLPM